MIEYLPFVLTGIGIIVAIIYYTLTLRNTNKTQQLQLETRQAQLFMQIYNRLTYTDFTEKWNEVLNYEWTDHDDFINKYGQKNNPKKNAEIMSLNNFFHGLGVLVAMGRIDIDLLGMHLGYRTVEVWDKLKSIILERREREGRPYLGIYFEFLKDEQLKRKTYPRGKASDLA